jgi:hypothetical protein
MMEQFGLCFSADRTVALVPSTALFFVRHLSCLSATRLPDVRRRRPRRTTARPGRGVGTAHKDHTRSATDAPLPLYGKTRPATLRKKISASARDVCDGGEARCQGGTGGRPPAGAVRAPPRRRRRQVHAHARTHQPRARAGVTAPADRSRARDHEHAALLGYCLLLPDDSARAAGFVRSQMSGPGDHAAIALRRKGCLLAEGRAPSADAGGTHTHTNNTRQLGTARWDSEEGAVAAAP